MTTVLAFLVALGLLIAIHEYGHYRMAVACGVKVLKFSVGFGKTIFKWKAKDADTEFAIGLLPLGGFVKMLDEREAPVEAAQRHLAFNTQPLRKRAAIVAAGPVANLLLAVVLYSMVNWMGVQEAKAILASPTADSLAQRAGLVGGEHVLQAAFVDEALRDVQSLEDLRWLLTRGALNGRDVTLSVAQFANGAKRELVLPLSKLDVNEVDATLFHKIGITGPWTKAVIGEVQAGGAAMRAGLREGDVVLAVGDIVIKDGQQLRKLIRESVRSHTTANFAPVDEAMNRRNEWLVERNAERVTLLVEPDIKLESEQKIGKISAYVGALPEFTTVRYGFFDGIGQATAKTWDVSVLTLRMMGKMVIGEASLKNLSGPLSIAEYAGKSANLGFTPYLIFLALISVSLGVLNLLPLPVLDGGHLMYYLWEAITGKVVSEAWMARFQRGGVAFLFCMMFIALYNDVTRLFVN